MTRRRRLILVVVTCAILLGGAAGVVWWWKHDSSGTLLDIAELNIQAAKFHEALAAVDGFISGAPDDWRGHYTRAKVLVRLQRYSEARTALDSAARLEPGQSKIPLMSAQTYAVEARQKMASGKTADVQAAIGLLAQGAGALADIRTADEKAALSVQQQVGMNQMAAASAQRALASLLNEEMLLADASGTAEDRLALEQQIAAATTLADESQKMATQTLLQVVTRDASRAEAARELVQLCIDREDQAALAAARGAIMALEDPPPEAVLMLVSNDLRSPSGQEGPNPADKERAADACRTLDRLLDKHPDQAQVKLARAELAVMLSDPATARRLCQEVLSGSPRNRQALLLEGNLLLSEGDKAGAEQKLYKLKTDVPLWPEAHYAYARAALAVGKDQPAKDAYEAMTRLDTGAMHVKLMRAELALVFSEFLAARQVSGEILRMYPRQPQARLIHAKALSELGETANAEKEALALKNDFPKWPDAQYAYARQALGAGRTAEALAVLEAVLAIDPKHVLARRLLVEARLRSGQNDQALTDAQACYQAQPDDPDVLRLLVRSAKQAQRIDLTTKALEKAAADASNDPARLMAMVEYYAILENRDAAMDFARRAAQGVATSPAARLIVARALVMIGRTPEAEKMLTDQLAADPDQAAVHAELGRIYAATGRLLPAIEEYRAAVRLAKENIAHKVALAQVLLNVGEVEECRKVLSSVDPSVPAASVLRMRVQQLLGEPVNVELLFPQASSVERSPLALGAAYMAAGQPQRAIETCLAEIQKNPDNPDIRALLGEAYLALGQRDKCLEQWEAAMKAAPGQLSIYMQLAGLLSRYVDTPQAVALLSMVPGGQKDLIDMTEGWLYSRAGDYAKAAEAFARPAANAAPPEHVRDRARMLRCDALAGSGRLDQAIEELDALSAGRFMRREALARKADLLAANRPAEQVQPVLDELTKIAVNEKDAVLFRRLAGAYVRIRQIDHALEVCDQAAKALPDDSRTYLTKAFVLDAAGRGSQTIEAYRKAIELQPGNIGIYQDLAGALDSQQRPLEAIQALRELERLGEAGRAAGIFRQGVLYAGWGLRTQAKEQFSKLAGLPSASNPQIRLALGEAFASLDLKDLAAAQLRGLPVYVEQYVPAGLILARLAGTADARLAILHDLQKVKPGRQDLLAAEMAAWMQDGKPAEAIKAFQTFSDSPAGKALPPQVARLAVDALLQTGNRQAAGDLAVRLAVQTRATQWRQIAAVLAMDRPSVASGVLPPAAEADPYSALLGACLAARAKDPDALGKWTARIAEIENRSADRKQPSPLPPAHRFLLAMASGQADQARLLAGQLRDRLESGKEAAAEMASLADTKAAGEEAARLLAATMAMDLGFTSLAQAEALAVLEARPASQWAASLAFRCDPDGRSVPKVLALLKPPGGAQALWISAEAALRDGKHAQAARTLEAAAKAPGARPELVLQYAVAIEGLGRLEEALNIYRRLCQVQQHPVALNNAASGLAKLYPNDASRLAEARKLAEAAVGALPDVAEFRDTLGWIQFLQGDYEQACAELHKALRRLPARADVHYHLGLAHVAAGRNEMGRWHLAAAVDWGGKTIPSTAADDVAAQAARLAREALARLQPDR